MVRRGTRVWVPCKDTGLSGRLLGPSDARRPAEELLHFALVAVWRVTALAERSQAQRGRKRLHRLARREAEPEAAELEPAVVQAAPEAELPADLVRHADAEQVRRPGRQARPPGREQRRVRLAEQARDLAQR